MSKQQYVLTEKTMKFSEELIDVCQSVKASTVNRPIISQLIRSGTSIGANYSEANNASSRKDFRNKMFIAKKEAQETLYWLKLLGRTNEGKEQIERLENLQDECLQIVKIIQKALSTLDGKLNEN